MRTERLYTTREVAEMWNVSASTIKRWADSGNLHCHRTAGGHRKFTAHDISEYQNRLGFEATGMLSTENWESPGIEQAFNQKKFDFLRGEILREALQNQKLKVRHYFERLHMRGLEFYELYDKIVMPIIDRVDEKALGIEISDGHLRLVMNNLDEAAQSIVPQLTQRRPNGKIALCGSLDCPSRVHVNAMARILEIEGWEVFNLGDDVTFELLAQMVKDEPVDLVCVSSIDLGESNGLFESFQTLFEATHPYRIPVLMAGKDLASPRLRRLYSEARFVKSFRKVRRHAVKLGRV